MNTIAAIATPFGYGGVGIIRVSGPEAFDVAHRIFRRHATPSAGKMAEKLVSHRVYHGYIVDPLSDSYIDEVLLVPMAAPRSYTREDVVEIQSHSGILLIQKLLELVVTNGARLAEPGEFTRRAFLNGRIDLSQAEGIIDLINANSEQALQLAINHLKGTMRDLVHQIIDELTGVCVDMQAAIEFPDEHGFLDDPASMQRLFSRLSRPIEQMLNNYQDAHIFRDGLRLSIIGRPNVGKSSILNRLLDSDKAIVTPFPGTTRDPVEAAFLLKGIPVTITDTAGLHMSLDAIEKIGMQKTMESIAQSDCVLFVLEAGRPFGPEDATIYNELRLKKRILIINKIDLDNRLPANLPPEVAREQFVMVSALDGTGFSNLREIIVRQCGVMTEVCTSHSAVPTIRQKKSLEAAFQHLVQAGAAIEHGIPYDLILLDLEMANRELKAIVGQSPSSDLLDEIFSRFCIGK